MTETNSKRQSTGMKTGLIGLAANISLFAAKLIAGILSGSVSIIADSINNLSDGVASAVTLIGFKAAGKPADKEHPFGHGRAEYISGLIVSIMIIVVGFQFAAESLKAFFSPSETDFSPLTLIILSVSIVVKLAMFFFYRVRARLLSSGTLRAAATDSVSDACLTATVLACAGVNMIFGIQTDAFAGIVVAAMIIFAGVSSAKESVSSLVGGRPDKDFVNAVTDEILAISGIVGVHDLVIHEYGYGNRIITLHAEVPDSMGFVAAHELIDAAEDLLKEKYHCFATIHMDPVALGDDETVELREAVGRVAEEIGLSIHDLRKTSGLSRENLIFDVVIPFGFNMTEDEVCGYFAERITLIDPKYHAAINIDRDMT